MRTGTITNSSSRRRRELDPPEHRHSGGKRADKEYTSRKISPPLLSILRRATSSLPFLSWAATTIPPPTSTTRGAPCSKTAAGVLEHAELLPHGHRLLYRNKEGDKKTAEAPSAEGKTQQGKSDGRANR